MTTEQIDRLIDKFRKLGEEARLKEWWDHVGIYAEVIGDLETLKLQQKEE